MKDARNLRSVDDYFQSMLHWGRSANNSEQAGLVQAWKIRVLDLHRDTVGLVSMLSSKFSRRQWKDLSSSVHAEDIEAAFEQGRQAKEALQHVVSLEDF